MVITKSALLGEFETWATSRWGDDDGTRRSDVDLLLDWRVNYSNSELQHYTKDDLQEFLLQWCPRKLSAPPETAGPMCQSIGRFIEFLSSTGRFGGGVGRAAEVISYVESLPEAMSAAMADPANFGMAKSLFAGMGAEVPDTDSPDELQGWLDGLMAEHNALPFEERRAVTDPFFEPKLTEVPFPYLPAPEAELAASAAAAPILAELRQLADLLGPDGRRLTQRGNLRLADARELVAALGTGDEMDPEIGGRVFKTHTSEHLPGLGYLVELALECGAARRHHGHLVPVKAWRKRSSLQQMERIWRVHLDLGFLSIQEPRYAFADDLHPLIEAGLPHWMIELLPAGIRGDVADIVERTEDVVQRMLDDNMFLDMTPALVSRLLERAERLGLLHWTDWTAADQHDWLRTREPDGSVTLTPLGRHLAATDAEEFGYRLRTVDLADASEREVLDLLRIDDNVDPEGVLDLWQTGAPAATRAQQLADALPDDCDAIDRLHVFMLFELLGPESSAPAVRGLLDGPASGHAALFLLRHGQATDDQVGGFVTVGPLVDLLSTITDPEHLRDAWQQATEQPGSGTVLDDIWRHDAPETSIVLEALGQALDKVDAKLARKALVKHRSWLATR